jgi:nucleotide-binding universal stress UspA family protein
MATDEGADVLVVGTHQRRGMDRLWHGSVSRGVLGLAPTSVACVPLLAIEDTAPPRDPRVVLAATDLSPLGNRAARHAYAVMPAGGVVHLLHVVEPPSPMDPIVEDYVGNQRPIPAEYLPEGAEIMARLRAVVPSAATERGIETRPTILGGQDAAEIICAAAERLGADLVCLGTRGRSGLVTMAGSVARKVMSRARHPLLLIPPPRDG